MQVSYEFILLNVITAIEEWKRLILSSYKGYKMLHLATLLYRK